MLKTFEQHSTPEYGYYDMSNANNPLLIENIKNLNAGNSIWVEYDEYSNFVKIEVENDTWFNKVKKLIEKQRGDYLGYLSPSKELINDSLVILPMASVL